MFQGNMTDTEPRHGEAQSKNRSFSLRGGAAVKRVAVDVTPILPGGENGGAKLFVLRLLAQLADLMPDTDFILLTQAGSHEELSSLDRVNVSRHMVVGNAVADEVRPVLNRVAMGVLPKLPSRVRRGITYFAYNINRAIKRIGRQSLLRNLKIELLFCPFTAPTYFDKKIPTVCTVYDLQYKSYPDFFLPEEVAHRTKVFQDACKKATALAAISNYSMRSAIQHGNLAEERIRCIYLRMAELHSAGNDNEVDILKKWDLLNNQYLLYPANFWRHKNHEMLFTAFAMARKATLPESVKLVCTGASGTRGDWLRQAAAAMGLDAEIIFTGYVPETELSALLANAAGVIFPSLYEGFGLPVVEAMAAGIPVACSNSTSLPEVAGEAAILFNPKIPAEISQAICSVILDGELRRHCIAEGLKRAEEFLDTRRMAIEYRSLFEFALTKHRTSSPYEAAYEG